MTAIDYRHNAQERIKVALKDSDANNALVTAQLAVAEATLALVEEQRIANLMDYLRLIDEKPGPVDDLQIREALGLA
jgi:hypothetical protein